MARNTNDLHALARILVGTRAADEARQLGGMFYDNLINRVTDTLQRGHNLLWRPSGTPTEASNDPAATPPTAPAHPQGPRRD